MNTKPPPGVDLLPTADGDWSALRWKIPVDHERRSSLAGNDHPEVPFSISVTYDAVGERAGPIKSLIRVAVIRAAINSVWDQESVSHSTRDSR